jgi:hypothetical protein
MQMKSILASLSKSLVRRNDFAQGTESGRNHDRRTSGDLSEMIAHSVCVIPFRPLAHIIQYFAPMIEDSREISVIGCRKCPTRREIFADGLSSLRRAGIAKRRSEQALQSGDRRIHGDALPLKTRYGCEAQITSVAQRRGRAKNGRREPQVVQRESAKNGSTDHWIGFDSNQSGH